MAESFFSALECESLVRRSFRLQAEARMAALSFFDPLRRHSALGYRSFFVYEQETAPEPLSQVPCTVNKYGTIPPAMIPEN